MCHKRCRLFESHIHPRRAMYVLKLKLLNEKGWVDTVVWNPYGKEKMGYDTFVCVESVKVCVAKIRM